MTGPRTHATRSPRYGFLDLAVEVLQGLDRGGGVAPKFKLLWDTRVNYSSPYWHRMLSVGLVRQEWEDNPIRKRKRLVVHVTEKGERVLHHYRAILQELDGVTTAGAP